MSSAKIFYQLHNQFTNQISLLREGNDRCKHAVNVVNHIKAKQLNFYKLGFYTYARSKFCKLVYSRDLDLQVIQVIFILFFTFTSCKSRLHVLLVYAIGYTKFLKHT